MKVVLDSWAWLPKSELTLVQQEALKHTLTIRPRKVGDHPGDPPGPLKLFVDAEDLLGVPREFFLTRRKQDHEISLNLTSGLTDLWSGPVPFAGSLFEEQAKAVASVSAQLSSGLRTGGIIRAVPAWGKTVTSCGLIKELGVPALVVVHKEFLMDQWQRRIEQFLPEAKVGRVQQAECDYAGKTVVIGLVQSLAQRDYPKQFYEWPGLVIFDEVHRVGAATWAPVPARFRARYRVGLSATPKRLDGADDVFFWHIGELIFAAQEQRLKPKIRRVYTDFRLSKTDNFNPHLAPKSIKLRFLCGSNARNRIIVDRLILALDAGRKVIVLSERLEHLRTLEAGLRKLWPASKGKPPSTGYYIGGKTEDELDRAAAAACIFATSQLVSEGLDIPALDTLFLTTPMANVEQSVGRILRVCVGKKDPVVVDFRDDWVGQFKKYGNMRDALYRRIA